MQIFVIIFKEFIKIATNKGQVKMIKIIKPKEFLTQLKNNSKSTTKVMPSDLLEIAELNVSFTFSKALNDPEFYNILKKATSDFNSNAALNGNLAVDFDDLYIKYSEYIEALKTFV